MGFASCCLGDLFGDKGKTVLKPLSYQLHFSTDQEEDAGVMLSRPTNPSPLLDEGHLVAPSMCVCVCEGGGDLERFS